MQRSKCFQILQLNIFCASGQQVEMESDFSRFEFDFSVSVLDACLGGSLDN